MSQPNGMLQPQTITNKLVRDEVRGRQVFKPVREFFKSYRELKRNITRLLEESHDDEVHVARSRRGQWGEWNETWVPGAKGPRLLREGWA